MTVIYEPKGRALEYSPLACNLYLGCTHGCTYCYAPGCMRRTASQWHGGSVVRKDVLKSFARDCRHLARNGMNDELHRVLFCFLSDPYQPIESELHITRQAISIARQWNVKVDVLTKGSYSIVSKDFSLMKDAEVHLGVTMSFVSDDLRRIWEPNASPVADRMRILREAHKMGIYTWVSMEPVICPEEAIKVVDKAHEFVDFWKVGKLNHNKAVESTVDWRQFHADITRKLDGYGVKYYIKEDLRKFAGHRKSTDGALRP